MIDRIPPQLRTRAVETFVGGAALVCGALAMLWLVAAVVVGTVALGRWIGGL